VKKLIALILLLPLAACNNETTTVTTTVEAEKPALSAGITNDHSYNNGRS